MYKPGGKGKESIPKTILEISEELEDRLKNRGVEPDSSFLSSNFKNFQKNAFPISQKVSGTLSVGSGEINAFLSLAGDEESELKGRMFITQYKIENGKTAEAFEKASAALKVLLESFWVNTEEKQQTQNETQKQSKIEEPVSQEKQAPFTKENSSPKEVARSIQQALLEPDIALEFNKLQEQGRKPQQQHQEEPVKTVTISTGAKALNDEKIVNYYSKDSVSKNNDPITDSDTSIKESSSLKSQLINVNFTPEQAEVVIQLLEENQKKYEPKSSMFGLLGDVVGKMLQALSKKLDQMIDAEKITNEKINSIYSAINNENYELFIDKYKGLEQKIKYCHDIICEAAQGQSIQSTNIINHILNKEKVPVSIRTLQNAFVTAIDNNIESALSIYKYADSNLHGEAHFDTIRGFLSHALNTLPDNEAEKFINVSSIRAFDDTVIFKEMIRAEKYELFNSSLQHCDNINEHSPSLYYFAAQRKDIDALHILAGKGANVNVNNGEALYTCFETNKPETAKVLINFGADIQSLKNRIEQIQKADPKYTLTQNHVSFLNELYKFSGLNQLGSNIEQSQETEIQEEINGENGDLGVHDGSWE